MSTGYLTRLRRSGLVRTDLLDRLLADLGLDPAADPDPESFAPQLIEAGLVTHWQHYVLQENLQNSVIPGRACGFFLGSYKLLDHLGTGGMGHVFLAEHVVMRRRVAIKVLPDDQDEAAMARFERESRATATLDHKNIIAAHDFGNMGDVCYMVMEYVDGEDLEALVKRCGPLEYAAAADYIRQAAAGLGHAHQMGMVHRDVKPSNLLVDAQGTVKLLDMGLARMLHEGEAKLTQRGNILGSADYVSPEQVRDSHAVAAPADQYSLGCTLYYLLTGHPPFNKGSITQRMLAHQLKPAPSILDDRPFTPANLVAICERMMAKHPEERFADCSQVESELAKWLADPDGYTCPQAIRAHKRATVPPDITPNDPDAGMESASATDLYLPRVEPGSKAASPADGQQSPGVSAEQEQQHADLAAMSFGNLELNLDEPITGSAPPAPTDQPQAPQPVDPAPATFGSFDPNGHEPAATGVAPTPEVDPEQEQRHADLASMSFGSLELNLDQPATANGTSPAAYEPDSPVADSAPVYEPPAMPQEPAAVESAAAEISSGPEITDYSTSIQNKLNCKNCGVPFSARMYRFKCPKCGMQHSDLDLLTAPSTPPSAPGTTDDAPSGDTVAKHTDETGLGRKQSPAVDVPPNVKATCPACDLHFTARWTSCPQCGGDTIVHDKQGDASKSSARHVLRSELTQSTGQQGTSLGQRTSLGRGTRITPAADVEPAVDEPEAEEVEVEAEVTTLTQRRVEPEIEPEPNESSAPQPAAPPKPARASRSRSRRLPLPSKSALIVMGMGGLIAVAIGLSLSGNWSSGGSGQDYILTESGERAKGQLVDGKREGTWVFYHRDGYRVREGTYQEGQEHGFWMYFDKTGQRVMEGTFLRGQKHGEWMVRYPDGGRKEQGKYLNGEKHGPWTAWYPNGQRQSQGMYDHGKQIGAWHQWDENGKELKVDSAPAG